MSGPIPVSDEPRAAPPRWGWGVGLALVGGALWTLRLQWAQQGERTPAPLGALLLLELPPWLVWIVAVPAMVALLNRVPFRPGSRLRAVLAHLALAGALTISASLLRLPALTRLAPAGVTPLRFRFITVELIPYDLSIVALLYVGLLAALSAVQLRDEVQQRARAAAELEAELANAQLRALRTQLDPHFIFNALQNISVMVDESPSTARRMIAQLGDLLRTTLGEHDHLVPLGTEIDFVRRYLALEGARFEDRLHVTIHVDPGAAERPVPPFVLQPLVENALRHGLGPRSTPGSLDIRAALESDALVITVSDNGLGVGDDATEGLGISVTRERLARLFPGPPSPGSLSLCSRDHGGTEAKVWIPLPADGAATR